VLGTELSVLSSDDWLKNVRGYAIDKQSEVAAVDSDHSDGNEGEPQTFNLKP
jgi:hypothetical protein